MAPREHSYRWHVDLHATGIVLRPEVITGACDAPDVARAVGLAVRDVHERRGVEILGRDVRTEHAADCARCAALIADDAYHGDDDGNAHAALWSPRSDGECPPDCY